MNGGGRQSQRRLEQVRGWRVREARPAALAEPIQSLQRQVERTARLVGDFISLWEEAIPSHLSEKTRVRGGRGGVFHVSVQDSAALYEIDRRLREGGLAAIRARLCGTLVRIKLAVEPLIDGENAAQ